MELGNNARVTLRPDAVALEEDEILQLILMPMSGTTLAENVFLRDTISIIIIDIDGKFAPRSTPSFLVVLLETRLNEEYI